MGLLWKDETGSKPEVRCLVCVLSGKEFYSQGITFDISSSIEESPGIA